MYIAFGSYILVPKGLEIKLNGENLTMVEHNYILLYRYYFDYNFKLHKHNQ